MRCSVGSIQLQERCVGLGGWLGIAATACKSVVVAQADGDAQPDIHSFNTVFAFSAKIEVSS
jgi:hypothetical protein